MNMSGFQPELRKLLDAQADFNADNVVVVVDRANVTPEPTEAVWEYVVPFHLEGGTSGGVIPFTGVIGAGIADTSTAGTAAVSSVTPAVVNGVGSVTISGGADAWLATETATLTLTYTKTRSGTVTDTFVVTFTAPEEEEE